MPACVHVHVCARFQIALALAKAAQQSTSDDSEIETTAHNDL